MPVSIEDQATSLLQRTVATAKANGVSASDVEAASIFESIAISLLLNPKAVLYVAHLARNALITAVTSELSALSSLSNTIADLGNVSYAIQDITSLEKAKNSLLQLEGQGSITASNNNYNSFNSAIDTFLNTQLSQNVRRQGSSGLVRPSAEAAASLPSDLQSVKSLHADMIDRLYSLAVGVVNFQATPFAALLGRNVTARSRRDIDSIISSLLTDNSAASSRDIAVKLITNRAAIKVIGKLPSVAEALIDTTYSLPPGYSIKGTSGPVTITATGVSTDTVALPVGATLNVNSISSASFPLATADLNNAAHLLSTGVTYPVSIPATTDLFIRIRTVYTSGFTLELDGSYTHGTVGTGWFLDLETQRYWKTFRVVVNGGGTTSSYSLSAIVTAIGSALSGVGYAVKFPDASSASNFIIYVGPNYDQVGIASYTYVGAIFYSRSAHSQLGISMADVGQTGTTPIATVVAAMQYLFGSIATVSRSRVGALQVKLISNAPTASMTIGGTAAAPLGISGTFNGSSQTVVLSGTVLGVATPAINPVPLVDVGDTVLTPTGSSTVQAVKADRLLLNSLVQSFEGPITVTSALTVMWNNLSSALSVFLKRWFKAPYSKDLSKLDAYIAPLTSYPTLAAVHSAIDALDSLRSYLEALLVILTDPATKLPIGAATEERSLVNGIATTFTERKYDRALDLFMKCRIQELFELDWQTASFSGQMLSSMSKVAQADVKFPNVAKDIGGTANSVRPG